MWVRNASKKSIAVLAWLLCADPLRGMKKNEYKDLVVMTNKIRNHGWNRIEKVLQYLHIVLTADATVRNGKIMKYISQYIWAVCSSFAVGNRELGHYICRFVY